MTIIKNKIKFLNKNLFSKSGLILCPVMAKWRNETSNDKLKLIYSSQDYVRLSSLKLVADEIYNNNIEGSVAELGVFQGDFAKYINILFPDKKLYLFDTFEGFSKSDLEIEKNIYEVDANDFSNTNIDLVKNKMSHPENCIFKKGFFPDTAKDIEDTFCFVSLDADLYEPIYKGLEYFYPRLITGGYIFIHDYNDTVYQGAKIATRQYCKENNISFFPLSDFSGSAIIVK